MNLSRRELLLASAAMMFAASSGARAADVAPHSNPGAEAADDKLLYIPPRGKPEEKVRVIAIAGRDGPKDVPALAVLSPDHVGLTVQEQPSLFWYLSKPVKTRLVITLMKDGDSDPVLELKLDGAGNGIQRIDLNKHKVKLVPDVQYEISLAIVFDPEHRDKDVLSSGVIKRIAPPDDLLINLRKRPKPIDRAILLARSGVWYDALATVSNQIDADAADKSSRMGRAALLDQVNLPDAASYDRAEANAN